MLAFAAISEGQWRRLLADAMRIDSVMCKRFAFGLNHLSPEASGLRGIWVVIGFQP